MYTISPGGYTDESIVAWTLRDLSCLVLLVCKWNCQSECKHDVIMKVNIYIYNYIYIHIFITSQVCSCLCVSTMVISRYGTKDQQWLWEGSSCSPQLATAEDFWLGVVLGSVYVCVVMLLNLNLTLQMFAISNFAGGLIQHQHPCARGQPVESNVPAPPSQTLPVPCPLFPLARGSQSSWNLSGTWMVFLNPKEIAIVTPPWVGDWSLQTDILYLGCWNSWWV